MHRHISYLNVYFWVNVKLEIEIQRYFSTYFCFGASRTSANIMM